MVRDSGLLFWATLYTEVHHTAVPQTDAHVAKQFDNHKYEPHWLWPRKYEL